MVFESMSFKVDTGLQQINILLCAKKPNCIRRERIFSNICLWYSKLLFYYFCILLFYFIYLFNTNIFIMTKD